MNVVKQTIKELNIEMTKPEMIDNHVQVLSLDQSLKEKQL